MDELVARDDAEEVDEALGGGADDGAHVVAADVGFEDGEVDVGVGVGGVVEAAARDGVGGAPEAEDAVDVEEVGEEGAVLARQQRLRHGRQRSERIVPAGAGALQGAEAEGGHHRGRPRRHVHRGGALGPGP